MSTETAPVTAAPGSARRLSVSQRWMAPGLDRLRSGRWTVAVAMAVLVLVSLWLRTRGLRTYYWIDEGLSVGIASHPLSHIPGLLHQDGSPPLYYLLLHVWMALHGRSEVRTHELSLIFALVTIPVAFWAGRTLFGRREAVICAVLAAGTPYLTQYGQETRMYALLALLALLLSAAFVHAFVYRRRGYLPVFSLSLVAALYTHNWALFLGLMSVVAFLLCVRESAPSERHDLWRDGAMAFGAVAILYAPWLPTLLYQSRHTGAPWDLQPVIWSLSQGLYSLVGGRGAAMALLLAGGSGLLALRRQSSGRVSRSLLAAKCLLVLGLGTVLLAWAYSKVTPAWALRYLAAVVGPLTLLFGVGLARAGRLGLVALALVACFWVLDPGPLPNSRDAKSNVGAVVAKLRPHLGHDPLVLSTQPEQVPTIAYYLPEVSRFGTPLGPVADPRIMDWRNALSRLRHSTVRSVLMPMVDRLARGQRVVLISRIKSPKEPLWMSLIGRYDTQWSDVLARDRRLRTLSVTAVGWQGSGLAVQGTVFEVR